MDDLCPRNNKCVGLARRHPELPDRDDAMLFFCMKEWTRLQQVSDKLEATAEARIEVQGATAAHLAQSIADADDLAIPCLATVSPGQTAPIADKDNNMPPRDGEACGQGTQAEGQG